MQEAFAATFPEPRQEALDALCLPEEELRGIDKRSLLVHGRDDQVIPPQTSQRLLDLIDDSELHIFGRCGHWTQIERSEEFAALVLQFLMR